MYQLAIKGKLKHRDMVLPKLLVTGCGGSVGKMLDSVWQTVFDHDILGVDSNSQHIQMNYPTRQGVHGSFYHTFDMVFEQKKLDQLFVNHKIEKVAHLAALPREHANADYELAKQYNVGTTKSLIDSIKRTSDPSKVHIIFGSCMSVYGDRRANPGIAATDAPNPNKHDYFALTKLECEQLLKDSGIPHTIMRFAPVCDPLNWWVDLHPSYFYFDLDQKIEWITARDSAKAIRQAMYKAEFLNGEIMNIGGGAKLTVRHREFMKEIFEARGVVLKSALDLSQTAFANTGVFGGHYTDSDTTNSQLGYRMQPIHTAYLRQLYRYPFPMRWLNKKLDVNQVIKKEYEQYSHIYQAVEEKDAQFMWKYFDLSKMETKEAMDQRVQDEWEVEHEERELHKRQLANMLKKQKEDFKEAKKQRKVRDAIERKWRIRRENLIQMGKDPSWINLDEIDRLEIEEQEKRERGEKIEGDEKMPEKELTEEEKIRKQEDEEDAAEKERSHLGY